jgi:hypothetical protein
MLSPDAGSWTGLLFYRSTVAQRIAIRQRLVTGGRHQDGIPLD